MVSDDSSINDTYLNVTKKTTNTRKTKKINKSNLHNIDANKVWGMVCVLYLLCSLKVIFTKKNYKTSFVSDFKLYFCQCLQYIQMLKVYRL